MAALRARQHQCSYKLAAGSDRGLNVTDVDDNACNVDAGRGRNCPKTSTWQTPLRRCCASLPTAMHPGNAPHSLLVGELRTESGVGRVCISGRNRNHLLTLGIDRWDGLHGTNGAKLPGRVLHVADGEQRHT